MKTLSKLLLAALISTSEKQRHKSNGRVVDPEVFVDLVASRRGKTGGSGQVGFPGQSGRRSS